MAQLGCEGALASPWTPVVHCSGQHDPCRFRASLSYPNPMQIVLQERLLEENNSPAPRDLADLVAKKHKTDSNRLKSTQIDESVEQTSSVGVYASCDMRRLPSVVHAFDQICMGKPVATWPTLCSESTP